MPEELQRRSFASVNDLWAWLEQNHRTHPGLWVVLQKTGSPTPSITFYDLLEAGIAFGWSESTRRANDKTSYLQKFTPRRVKGTRSARNTAIAERLEAEGRMTTAGRAALEAGAPILTDAHMVASGVTRARLPRDNEVVCLLRDERTPSLAREWGTTRSAAAVSLWGDRLSGAVVAIGNAPTALFHLLELLADGAPAPAAIIGVPVGFIGAAESKQALIDLAAEHGIEIPYVTVRGRRGGSAMTSSALNALAQEAE